MSVGLLLITHNDLGAAFLNTTINMLGFCPLLVETLSVTTDSDPDQLKNQACDMVTELDQGDGVLILTDMYGSTPSNIAHSLENKGGISVVSGINLPMLVRVMNYPHLSLESITAKAVTGGRDGILNCTITTGRCADSPR